MLEDTTSDLLEFAQDPESGVEFQGMAWTSVYVSGFMLPIDRIKIFHHVIATVYSAMLVFSGRQV